jgi:hypothetical protein
MGYRIWNMEHGIWNKEHGSWSMDHGKGIRFWRGEGLASVDVQTDERCNPKKTLLSAAEREVIFSPESLNH